MNTNEFEKEFEKHKDVYTELAEKKAIESLGLTESQVVYAKGFETTKQYELMLLKNNLYENLYGKKQHEKKKELSFLDVLFGRFN